MTIDAVSEMTNNALYVIIKVSLPVLLWYPWLLVWSSVFSRR